MKLRLDRIRLDVSVQVRAHIDQNTVEEYAAAMLRGDHFPPVIVFQDGGEFILADGWHRVKAARLAKLKHILAEIRQGSRQDALRFALGANHKHGLRRTNGDKRRAVEIALTEFGKLSDRLLAEMCGVSHTFATNMRQQLATVASSPRMGADGKLRTLPVNTPTRSQTGGSAARAQHQADQGSGSNGEVENPAFIEVADAMAGLEEMVEDLVHDHPDNTTAVLSVISKVRSDLLQIEKRLRASGER